MNDFLEFGDGSWEEARGVLISTIRSHQNDLNGNGKPGIKSDMEEVKQTLVKIETFGRATAFWGKVIAGLLGLAIAGAGFYIAYFEEHHHVSEVQSGQKIMATDPSISK